MQKILVIAVFALVCRPCCSRPLEESVVSVYTPTHDGPQLGVYGQIASNIAEKITAPIYRLFNVDNTARQTTKRPFEHIELQDPEQNSTRTTGRDVEELSPEAITREENKPEKVTLFTNYLPITNEKPRLDVPSFSISQLLLTPKSKGKLEIRNYTKNEFDDEFDDDFDEDFGFDEDVKPRGPFLYLFDLLGSIIKLLWGGFLWIFKPNSTEDVDS